LEDTKEGGSREMFVIEPTGMGRRWSLDGW
jgi:hypothetical protein